MESSKNKNDNKFYKLYIKYKNVLLFNKNLAISGTSSFLVGGIAAQIFHSHYQISGIINSISTLLTEYSVFFPLFFFLFYMDNRYRYKNPITGKKDSGKIRTDFKKLLAAFAVSEIIYSFSKVILQYYLLHLPILEPYQSGMISTILSWVFSASAVNVMVRVTKLVR